MNNMDTRKKREGPMGYLPTETPKKKIFYIRALIGNREAIEAKKDFEHPRKN